MHIRGSWVLFICQRPNIGLVPDFVSAPILSFASYLKLSVCFVRIYEHHGQVRLGMVRQHPMAVLSTQQIQQRWHAQPEAACAD